MEEAKLREEREKEEAALREKEKAEAAEAAIQEDAATEVSKGRIKIKIHSNKYKTQLSNAPRTFQTSVR